MASARAGLLTALVLALACAGSGMAQTSPPGSAVAGQDGDSVVVAELTVNAPLRGPALWKVARGDSEVIILGGIAPLPHTQEWDQSRFERALDHANELLTPPSGRLNVLSAAGFAIRALQVRQPFGHSLERNLPPALAARFAAERQSLNLGPQAYAHWKPAVAGILLLADFRRKAGFSNEKPNSTVRHLADDKHVRVRTMGEVSLGALFNSLVRMSDAQQNQCLADELDAIDIERPHARDAAAAWARGDLAGARANSSGPVLERCVALLSSYTEVLERSTADSTAAIEDALKRPGKTVAVIDLRFLLRANGVLDRLKARGATITVPPE